MPPSFFQEVSSTRGGRGSEAAEPAAESAAPAEAQPEVVTAQQGAADSIDGIQMPKHGDIFMEGLPQGLQAEKPAVEEPAKVEPAVEAKVETPPEVKLPTKIKIGSREFATADEALAYAQELDMASQRDQAYIDGLKEGQKKPEGEQPAPKTAYEEFAEKVFEDPKKAAQEFQERITADIEKRYNESVKAQNQAIQAEAHKKAVWDNFYKQNPDLSSPETRDILEGYLFKSFVEKGVLKPTDSNEAFAEQARKTLRIQREAASPKVELPSGPVVTTATAQEATTQATAPKKQESVDFITQLKTMRTRQ